MQAIYITPHSQSNLNKIVEFARSLHETPELIGEEEFFLSAEQKKRIQLGRKAYSQGQFVSEEEALKEFELCLAEEIL